MASTLTKKQTEEARQHVLLHLETHDSITNRELRAISNLSYDQCITFFNKMVLRNKLKRVGSGSATKYIRP